MTGDEMRKAAKELRRHNEVWAVNRNRHDAPLTDKMIELALGLADTILAIGQHGKQETCPLCAGSLGGWMTCPHCDEAQWIKQATLDASSGCWGGEVQSCNDCGNNYEIMDHGCDGFELRKE